MIIGRKTRNIFQWPALPLQADANNCINCEECEKNFTMSIDVSQMVQRGAMEHSECILCGTCIDVSPKGVITYSFDNGP